jgi:hypothetical protein
MISLPHLLPARAAAADPRTGFRAVARARVPGADYSSLLDVLLNGFPHGS